MAPVASRPLMWAVAATPSRAASRPRAAGSACREPALPARFAFDVVQAFGQAVGHDLLPAEPASPSRLRLRRRISIGSMPSCAGDLVDLRLAGEGDLRHAEAAEGAEAHLVGVGEAAVGMHVGDAVGAAVHQQRVAEHARAVVAVGAAVEQHLDLARDQRAVAARAGLHADREGMARAHHLEILLARQDQLHRALGLQRQQHQRSAGRAPPSCCRSRRRRAASGSAAATSAGRAIRTRWPARGTPTGWPTTA